VEEPGLEVVIAARVVLLVEVEVLPPAVVLVVEVEVSDPRQLELHSTEVA